MGALKWTAEAEASLRDVYNHIAQNRPTTARRTIESILNKVESLREASDLGHQFPHRRPAVRKLTYGQFQVAYLLTGDRQVIVLGVFHGLIFLPLN
ncbi:MAG: type II toxin-antitoxin system RelE/ParE family toxin [bacterium]|nr:type II toxin-antitoxin system RelE/ParE family toxin [bacterium]